MSGATRPHAERLAPAIGSFAGTVPLLCSPGQLGCREPLDRGTQEGLPARPREPVLAQGGAGQGRDERPTLGGKEEGAAGGRLPLQHGS